MSFYVCYPQKSRKPYTCFSLLCGKLASRQKRWIISNTILIDKNRGDETEASSYRPIGLANTLYIQTMDASNHKHSLRICRSKLYTQHHASWFSQTERPHSPAQKCDYGTRRCQTLLLQRHLCPYCGFYLSFQYH